MNLGLKVVELWVLFIFAMNNCCVLYIDILFLTCNEVYYKAWKDSGFDLGCELFMLLPRIVQPLDIRM